VSDHCKSHNIVLTRLINPVQNAHKQTGMSIFIILIQQNLGRRVAEPLQTVLKALKANVENAEDIVQQFIMDIRNAVSYKLEKQESPTFYEKVGKK